MLHNQLHHEWNSYTPKHHAHKCGVHFFLLFFWPKWFTGLRSPPMLKAILCLSPCSIAWAWILSSPLLSKWISLAGECWDSKTGCGLSAVKRRLWLSIRQHSPVLFTKVLCRLCAQAQPIIECYVHFYFSPVTSACNSLRSLLSRGPWDLR